MLKYCWLFLLLNLFYLPSTYAQTLKRYLGDESALYAETKQVNQFFRRFNCEEAIDGSRVYPGDSLYHNRQMRTKYLDVLFDEENTSLTSTLKRKFIRQINNPQRPQYLDFHGGDWFAEVSTDFTYKGKTTPVTLFLELEEAPVGSKWVFTNVYFEPFSEVFENKTDQDKGPAFIHPLSHELDFMNLIKVFRNTNIEKYAEEDYKPDYLTLFLYELKRNNLKFIQVNKVKFHFFQIDGWYFELDDFIRKGHNRGWLISQMTQIPRGKKELLLKYIYHQ